MLRDGMVYPIQLRAALFFCEGISNGGLFWRTNAREDLQVGSLVQSAALQEHIRTLKICSPIVFASEPLAIFSRAPDAQTTREPLHNRAYNRARQTILSRVLRVHGSTLIDEARALVRSRAMQEQLDRQLADITHLPAALKQPRQFAKGVAKILLVPDPLSKYWRVSGEILPGFTDA